MIIVIIVIGLVINKQQTAVQARAMALDPSVATETNGS